MPKIYRVGGSIRDEFLGLNNSDIDFCVEASSFEEMVKYLGQKYTITRTFPEYGTCKTKERIDFALCRLEINNQIIGATTIKEDLARRDFTVNAIAQDIETKEYIDPFNGFDDIKGKILRVIGSIDRLKEDPLRILRAMRFHITKHLSFEDQIDQALKNSDFINTLERIPTISMRQEMNKCFKFSSLDTLSFLNRYPLFYDQLFKSKLHLKASVTEE